MIRVRCPSCGKALAVGPALAGKLIACPVCEGKVRVAPPPPDGALTKTEVSRKPASPARNKPPLDDDNDGEVKRKERKRRPRPDDDLDDDIDTAKPKRKKRRKSKPQTGSAGAFYGGLTVVGLILAGLSFAFPTLVFVPFLLGSVLAIAGGIWFLKVAYSESAVEGALCLLLFPYSIYFLLTHVEQSLRPFLVSLVGWLVLLIAFRVGAERLPTVRVEEIDFARNAAVDEHRPAWGEKLDVDDADIYYTKGATEAEARNIEKHLRAWGFFGHDDDDPKIVLRLSKSGNSFVIAMKSHSLEWNNPNAIGKMRELADRLSRQAVSGNPVEIWLCDADMQPKSSTRK